MIHPHSDPAPGSGRRLGRVGPMSIFQKHAQKWHLALAVTPIVVIVAVFKCVYHLYGLEVLPVSALLPGLIAANVFLIGFLISGILLDYKEAERLPGDLAASFTTMADELAIVYRTQRAAPARECLEHVHRMIISLRHWFYRVEHTDDVLHRISELTERLAALAPMADANTNFLIKEQLVSIRRTLIRVRTIRGTYFVPSGYAVAEATNVLVIVGLLVTRIDTFYEAIFFTGVIAFLTTYMLLLLRELDDPFNYSNQWQGSDEISLLPLLEAEERITSLVHELAGQGGPDPKERPAEVEHPVSQPTQVSPQEAAA